MEQISEILKLTSLTPIAFYGKVVDQHGAPIAGVTVTASVQAVTRFMQNDQEQYSTTTNSDGRFQFTGLHGQDMGIFLAKEGYEFKSNLKCYEYSALSPDSERHHPDPKVPVVFTMWKIQGPEPLVHFRLDRVGVPVNGTPTAFDLLAGKKVSNGGDLFVKVERHPEHIVRGQPFDWKAAIEVPGGGIAEFNDAYPNEAPAEGYETQIDIDMPANAKMWQSSVTRNFYVKARNGSLYARVMLRITADYEPPPTAVTMEAFVNPSGSRNLEYDPNKRLPTR